MDSDFSNPPEYPTSPEEMLSSSTVCQCSTLNEAQIIVSLLESFGIHATIDAENYLRMMGSMVPGWNGVRVQVRQMDLEAAREILAQSPEAPSSDFSEPA